MTRDGARKRATRARSRETGEPYTRAARAAASASEPPAASTDADDAKAPQGHPFKRGHWIRERCAEWACNLERDHPVHQIGGLTPPEDWLPWAHGKPMLSTTHDGTTRTVTVLDGQAETVLASITAPWRPAEDLLAEYEAEGLLRPSMSRREIELGRPDLLAHELGYADMGGWRQWPDGSWRSPAYPLDRRHVATIRPLAPGSPDLQVLIVHEVPGGRVVVDEMIDPIDPADIDERLHEVLDQHGYTVSRWGWKKLPGGVRYGLALPGHLAERSWWTTARLRVLREYRTGAPDLQVPHRTFRAGEEVTMHQWGSAGVEQDRDAWWTSTDIDGAHIIKADAVEVLEVLEDIPPTWDAAALTVDQVVEVLAPHHAGAAAAAAAWAAAGLHVAHERGQLAIRTPAPERRKVGVVPRDQWDGNRHTKPYEVVVDEERQWLNRRLDALPLDPVAAVPR